jgi:hypothetical protein
MRELDLLRPESKLPIGVDYKLKTTLDAGGAAFTVFKDSVPLVSCVLATETNDD